MENLTIYNTDDLVPAKIGTDIMSSRRRVFENIAEQKKHKVSIAVLAYNRIEKTRRCVESILKYTEEIDYELMLFDNGSEEKEILEYFKSVEHPYKKIFTLTKNNVSFCTQKIYENYDGKYLVIVANDAIVTTNWLKNLLTCMESDEKIGFVQPLTTNTSNNQEPIIDFNSFEEMQEIAKEFNVSNPSKWEERIRLVNSAVTILSQEIIDTVGKFDVGFYHDFGEDDYCLRIRRNGYKLVLCGDTFIGHDHDFRKKEDKDPEDFVKSIEIGRTYYKQKHYGLDPWSDISNYEIDFVEMLQEDYAIEDVNILAVDVRAGQPLLDVRNYLRKRGVVNTTSFGFTTEAKYYLDLQTLCDMDVSCDRIEYIKDYYFEDFFDIVICPRSINCYGDGIRVLEDLLSLVKPGGILLAKLENVLNLELFSRMYQQNKFKYSKRPQLLLLEEVLEVLLMLQVKHVKAQMNVDDIGENNTQILRTVLENSKVQLDTNSAIREISSKDYYLRIIK